MKAEMKLGPPVGGFQSKSRSEVPCHFSHEISWALLTPSPQAEERREGHSSVGWAGGVVQLAQCLSSTQNLEFDPPAPHPSGKLIHSRHPSFGRRHWSIHSYIASLRLAWDM